MTARGKSVLAKIWLFIIGMIVFVLLAMFVMELYFGLFSYEKSTIYMTGTVTRQYTEEANDKMTEYYTVVKCADKTFTIAGYENYCKSKDKDQVQLQINKVSYHGFKEDEYYPISIM